MFTKTTLIPIGGIILLLAQVTSQLPLNNNDSYMPNEAQEMVLKDPAFQQEAPTRISPSSDNRGQIQEAPMRSGANDRVLRIQALKNIHDENRRQAQVNIRFPVQAMRMLKQLGQDIEWSLFQELYEHKSDFEKQLLASSKDKFLG